MTIGSELDAALAGLQAPPSPPVDLTPFQAEIDALRASVALLQAAPPVDLAPIDAQIADLMTRMLAAETALAAPLPVPGIADFLSLISQLTADVKTLDPTTLATLIANVQALMLALQPPIVTPAPDDPPVWKAVPTVTFSQGIPGSFPLKNFVSDPNGDPLTIDTTTLPAGCTFDGANINYDGVGLVSKAAVTATADDGRP